MSSIHIVNLSPKRWCVAGPVIFFAAFSVLSVSGREDSTPAPAIDETLKQAADTIRHAQNPSDLDSLLQDLRLLQNRAITLRASGSEMPQAYGKIEGARRFVVRWQDYLSHATSGDPERAREILEGLSQTDEIGLIPRSEILARIHGPVRSRPPGRPAIKELLDRIKTLDEMSAALETVKTWIREGRTPLGELQLAMAALTALDRTYSEFNAGLSTSLDGFMNEARMSPDYVMPLRAQLLALILPRYLGLAGDSKPGPGEGVHAFLDRIVAEAIAQKNYVLAARAREVQYSMKYGNREMQASQAAAFIAANNQEEARQYAMAVVSYQKALAMGTDVVPPKVIGERLAAIQKEHPAEYQEGMRQYLAPQMPRSFDPRLPPFGPGMKPPKSKVFPVPAVSPSSSASPPK